MGKSDQLYLIDIKPIAHIPPYRRIDPLYPNRKLKITWEEWKASGTLREPDAEVYKKFTRWEDYTCQVWWELKEKYR